MPLYAFRCPHCELEFEVSRKMSEASNPANCPLDGSAGERIFTAPTRLNNRGVDAPPEPKPAAPQPANNWSHFGHSHGGGVGGHSHGPRRPPPPPASS